MKPSILIGLCMALVLLTGTAAADWNVTWTPIKESIIDKEYIITVQNMQSVKRDVNISSFFAETSFDISELADVEFFEWAIVPYNYTVDHYDEVEHSEYSDTNGTWYNWTESVYNYTEIIESTRLDWDDCKAQLFKENGTTKEDNYGFINIPKFGSEDDGDGTYNGTKIFKLTFRTPVVYDGSYGSLGKVALLLDGEEHHPYWNTSWSSRQDVILTGGASGAQTDYQLLLNVSWIIGMQTDFDDLRFCNDTHEIDSWLESKVDSSYALVWVEFPTTPADGVNQTYYEYYGNAGAASDWDGDATFPQYHGVASSNFLDSVASPYEDIAIRIKWKRGATTNTWWGLGTVLSDGGGDQLTFKTTTTHNGWYYWKRNDGGTADMEYGDPGYDTNWHITDLFYDASQALTCYVDDVHKGTSLSSSANDPNQNMGLGMFSSSGTAEQEWSFVRKYAANPPTYALGSIQYYAGSIHYNATSSYNHTIESNGTIIANRTITPSDDINWTAAALTNNCQFLVTEYNYANSILANFTVFSNTLDWLQITNLTPAHLYRLQYANGTEINTTNATANGIINYTEDLTPDDYQLLVGDTSVNTTLHSSYPAGDLQTNYTGIVKLNYIVESNFPLNHSSLAFLWGLNHTPTSDMHSYLKVPANSIAADGIYRAHNRNTTPYLSWEGNSTITDGNVWQWNGGDNDSFWIAKQSINATHTWINVSGETTNMFPSMFYLGRNAMYSAPKTGFEINKAQGIIMKIWDLEQFRGRSNDYYISLFFDTGLEAAPSGNIELWYCNDSFDPDTHDPKEYCDYKESWNGTRWTTHRDYQPHANVSFCEPLTISADISSCSCPPTEVNYLYLYSNTVSSKSYILNATNHDPGICNLTFAQTHTMWTFDEVSKTSTPVAYTPSIFQLFTRDYTSMDFQLYIANNQEVWGHSGIDNKSVGISDVTPTHCRYNYFWWDNTTDYNMTNVYTDDFYVNVTYGFDPDNGAALTHVLSLYTSGGSFVATVNDTLVGNATDEDIFFTIDEYTGNHKFQIVSTDNEGSTSTSWSPVFALSRGTDEEIPLNLFIVLMVMMFGSLFYIYHAETYISKIVTSLITTWMSFMLSSMIVSGTVVLNYAELSSADAFVYGSYTIQIASLSHFFMFTGVVSALFMLTFTIKLVIDTYLNMQEKRKAENEWDGVEEQ